MTQSTTATLSTTFEPVSERNQAQAFLPILATLFFAAITSPMLLGWQNYGASGANGQGITRNVNLEVASSNSVSFKRVGLDQLMLAQCTLPEHRQPGHCCSCRTN